MAGVQSKHKYLLTVSAFFVAGNGIGRDIGMNT
jgi:hypothetical protein